MACAAETSQCVGDMAATAETDGCNGFSGFADGYGSKKARCYHHI